MADSKRDAISSQYEVRKLALQEKVTIGVDIGNCHYCVLDAKGEVVEEGKLGTTKTLLNA